MAGALSLFQKGNAEQKERKADKLVASFTGGKLIYRESRLPQLRILLIQSNKDPETDRMKSFRHILLLFYHSWFLEHL